MVRKDFRTVIDLLPRCKFAAPLSFCAGSYIIAPGTHVEHAGAAWAKATQMRSLQLVWKEASFSLPLRLPSLILRFMHLYILLLFMLPFLRCSLCSSTTPLPICQCPSTPLLSFKLHAPPLLSCTDPVRFLVLPATPEPNPRTYISSTMALAQVLSIPLQASPAP